jgi:hypothetical protein
VNGRIVRFTGQHLLQLVEAMTYKPTPGIQQRYYAAWNGAKALDGLLAIIAEERAQNEARKAANAAVRREASLQRKPEMAAARQAAKEAKRLAGGAARQLTEPEPLDYENREPSYWTRDRKERLRLERVARMRPKRDGDAN